MSLLDYYDCLYSKCFIFFVLFNFKLKHIKKYKINILSLEGIMKAKKNRFVM